MKHCVTCNRLVKLKSKYCTWCLKTSHKETRFYKLKEKMRTDKAHDKIKKYLKQYDADTQWLVIQSDGKVKKIKKRDMDDGIIEEDDKKQKP